MKSEELQNFVAYVRKEFEDNLSVKPQWGIDEIMVMFDGAVAKAAMEMIQRILKEA